MRLLDAVVPLGGPSVLASSAPETGGRWGTSLLTSSRLCYTSSIVVQLKLCQLCVQGAVVGEAPPEPRGGVVGSTDGSGLRLASLLLTAAATVV